MTSSMNFICYSPFIHACDAVERQIAERKYPESATSEIANEIFGRQVGSTYVKGMVDSRSEEDFLEAKKNDVLKREVDNVCVVPRFFFFFLLVPTSQSGNWK